MPLVAIWQWYIKGIGYARTMYVHVGVCEGGGEREREGREKERVEVCGLKW